MMPAFSPALALGLAAGLLALAGAVALWPHPRRREARRERTASLRRLDEATGGRGGRYRVPWCLVVGAEGSGRRTLLAHARLHRRSGGPGPEGVREKGAATFWLLDPGVMVLAPGVEAPASQWRALLRHLRQSRARRPLDAILLTLSAEELVRAAAPGAEAAPGPVEALSRVLRSIHRELGMRLPIYVLVTRCDVLPGFQGFCHALPPRHREEMLGWSSPYAFETPYATGWVDEAIDVLHRGLCLAQLEALALGRAGPRERGDLLLFPAAVGQLVEPLRRVLDPLFMPGAWHEPMLLRGVYFCGDPGASAGERPGPDASRHPAFVSDLLARKLFPEHGLAHPVAGREVANSRARSALWAAVAVGLVLAPLTLWLAVASLREDLPPVERTLASVAGVTHTFREARDALRLSALEREELKRHAELALAGMSHIQTDHLSRWLLPTSWLSGLDGEVHAAMQAVFEDVVFAAFRESLERSRMELLSRGAGPAEQGGLLGPARAPELLALRSLEQDLARLTERMEAYNVLCGAERRPKLERVPWLAQSLYELRLGSGFTRDTGLYADALAAARCEPYEALTPEQARAWAWRLVDTLHRRLLVENPLEQDVKALSEALAALRGGGQEGEAGVAAVRAVATALQKNRADVEDADAAWLARERLGEPFPELWASLRASRLLEARLEARELETRWQAGFEALRERLLRAEAPLLGRPLLLEKQRWVMAPRAVSLQALLTDFLAQPYLQEEHGEPVPTREDAPARVLWDVEGVEQALRLVPAYEAFVHGGLGKAPEELREVLGALAREQCQRGLRAGVARARRVEPLASAAMAHEREGLAAEVAGLGRVAPPLRRLIDTAERLGLSDTALELRGLLASDAEALLRRVDTLLEGDRLYVPDASLAEWSGERPPALEAFAVADAEMLGEYLKAQRAGVETLSRDYAATPVTVLEAVTAGLPVPPLLSKWQRIAAGLRQRERLVPGNSVQVLETFIQSDMMGMSRASCLGRLARPWGEASDFFLARREALRERLRARCEDLSARLVVEGYRVLAGRFNRTLAGRYPFSIQDTGGPEQGASARDVRDFLRELDAYLPTLDAYLARAGEEGSRLLGPGAPDILAFLARMRRIRFFLAHLVEDPGEAPELAFSVGARFWANRHQDRAAQGIIQWRLEVGDARVDGTPGLWRQGEPLRVVLRWAKDGPLAPVSAGQRRGARVGSDGSVTFEYDGPWALLRLLREHGSPGEHAEAGSRLGFPVLLAPRQGGEARRPSMTESWAWLRLRVFTPEGRVPLDVPRHWPTRAPAPVAEPSPPQLHRTQESP